MRQFAGPWLREHLRKMLIRLEKTPDKPAPALNTGLFPLHMMIALRTTPSAPIYEALLLMAFDQGDKQVQRAERQAVISGFLAMLLSWRDQPDCAG